MRRLSLGAAQSGLVCAVDRHQSSVSSQCAQGRQHGACASQFGELLYALERPVRSRPGALSEGSASRRREPRKSFTHWVATIQYAYAEPAKDPKTRRWNPLGFKIVDFRIRARSLGRTTGREGDDHDRQSNCRCRRSACALLRLFLLSLRRVRRKRCRQRACVDSRIRVAAYNGEEVYKLRGFVGYQIDLEFEPGEIFTGLGAGDMEGLSFVGQDNHLFLKPKAARVATNLTVLTSRRHYQFDYTARAQRPTRTTRASSTALRFTYPPLPSQSAADAAAKRLDSQLRERVEPAAAEHRLLVLRRSPRLKPDRRLGRRRAYAAAVSRRMPTCPPFSSATTTAASRC